MKSKIMFFSIVFLVCFMIICGYKSEELMGKKTQTVVEKKEQEQQRIKNVDNYQDINNENITEQESKEELNKEEQKNVNNNTVINNKSSETANKNIENESENHLDVNETEEVKPKEIIEEKPVQVDEKYIELKNKAKFENYSLCSSKSEDLALEYASNGDANFKNTFCESISYNGELLGYSLTIFFRDGTSKIY